MIEHGLHPALTVKQVEPNLTPQELGYEQVTLPLQVLYDSGIHLGEELVERGLIVAGLFDDIKGSSRDLPVVD